MLRVFPLVYVRKVQGFRRREATGSAMIASAESTSDIVPFKNSNNKQVKAQELASFQGLRILRVLFEELRAWLTFGKPHKWKQKFFRKFPLFIFFVSALEVVLFYGAEEKIKSILIYDNEKKQEIWRFWTYMLLHRDSVHLGLNVLIQGLLGTPLELEQGPLRCAAIYFGGGLAGSVGASALGAFTLMVGASGGVYALLVSHIPNVVLSLWTIKYACFRIAMVTLLTISDVLYILLHVYINNNERPQIGWVAHASGAAAGLILGFLLFNGTSEWKRKFQMTSCVILGFSFLLAIIFFLAHP